MEIYIPLISGDIVKEKADVIINSTTCALNLDSGPVSRCILKGGGDILQRQCREKYPNGIKHDEIAVTDAGNLRAGNVYHLSLPGWSKDKTPKALRALVEKCLTTAEESKHDTIAFPALGTGTLLYPPETVATIFFETVRDFAENHTNEACLSKVIFVVNPAVPKIVQAFTKVGAAFNSDKLIVAELAAQDEGFKDVELVVVEGDITQQKDDVIVNSAEYSGDVAGLMAGTLSEAIHKAGGATLKAELQQKFPDGINDWEVAKTSGGDLSCKYVYHTSSRKWTADTAQSALKKLGDLLTTVLKEADVTGMTSIAIPAIGTGSLGYPPKDVARILFETVSTLNAISLERVKFVAHSSSKGVLKVLEDEMAKSGNKINLRDGFPLTWAPMARDDYYMSVPLEKGNLEYEDVAKGFAVRMGAHTIVSVERIQNRKLFAMYLTMKQDFNKRNPGVKNERILWHGTSLDAVASINLSGFNRSYCGKNATAYGSGVYFAKHSSYSASDTYSRKDANGLKRMYQARVLTGRFVQGNSGMRTPPAKDDKNPNDKYDSVANSTSDPDLFVIFHDAQAYPSYLITFTT